MQLSLCTCSPICLVHTPIIVLSFRDSGGGEGVRAKSVYLYFKIAKGVNSGGKKKKKSQGPQQKYYYFLKMIYVPGLCYHVIHNDKERRKK